MTPPRQDKRAERSSWVVKEIAEYGVHDPYSEADYAAVIAEIAAVAKLRNGSRILDVGCGSAAYGIRFAKRGFAVTGVDIAPEAVESARRRAKQEGVKASFVIGDAERTPFPDSSFDVAFCGGVIHHFPDMKPLMDELVRVTKDGGCIVAVEPNKENPHVRLSMEPGSLLRYKHLTPNEHSIHSQELLDLLGKRVRSSRVSYKLMVLSSRGRHETKRFLDKPFIYRHAGFVVKNQAGGCFRKLLGIIVYNTVHAYQWCSRDPRRKGNFFLLAATIKK
jgi:ubiquinone/menaquinone biosynthesis C-methylase UbiE